MKNETNIIFQSSSVTEREVEDILMHLQDSSSGWDDLKTIAMKTIKRSITFTRMYATNPCFQKGSFSRELMNANILHNLKSGDEMVFINYIPVSVPRILSEIL